jgi:phosphoribosylamine--glycine ligase
MLTADGPRVIEYNSRFGDPEAQVVLPRLKGDLAYVMRASAAGDLAGVELDWENAATVGVVVASGGYPGSYDAGKRIEGLLALEQGVVAFHAGTRFTGNGFVTSGGRVLTVVASGPTVEAARENAYRNVEKVRFDGAFFRRDIAAA